MKVLYDNLIEMDRADLDAMARAAWNVVEHPEGFTPEQLAANDELLYELELVICFGPEWSVHLVPIGFSVVMSGFYPELVEAFLMDVGEEVREAHPVQVGMARQAAQMCDYQGFGTEFRLDCLRSLNEILAALWEAKDALTQVDSDELPG